jgi:hypothetical protein
VTSLRSGKEEKRKKAIPKYFYYKIAGFFAALSFLEIPKSQQPKSKDSSPPNGTSFSGSGLGAQLPKHICPKG